MRHSMVALAGLSFVAGLSTAAWASAGVMRPVDAGMIDAGRTSVSFSAGSCSANGHHLQGKVQVVTSFPDVKVQMVSSFPDLKVQRVASFPDHCGKWQFVDSFPDFKIQYVTSFPDLKIQMVTAFPGIP